MKNAFQKETFKLVGFIAAEIVGGSTSDLLTFTFECEIIRFSLYIKLPLGTVDLCVTSS